MKNLEIVPLGLDEANEHVARWHRHHQEVVGHKFSLGVEEIKPDGRMLVGVAIVGRPVARMNDNGWTLEVTRVATDGTANACSALYGAAWRVAREMGYRRLITYTLASEPGSSLKGAGWKEIGKRGGGSWDRPSRRRVDKAPTGQKTLWEVNVAAEMWEVIMSVNGKLETIEVSAHSFGDAVSIAMKKFPGSTFVSANRK